MNFFDKNKNIFMTLYIIEFWSFQKTIKHLFKVDNFLLECLERVKKCHHLQRIEKEKKKKR